MAVCRACASNRQHIHIVQAFNQCNAQFLGISFMLLMAIEGLAGASKRQAGLTFSFMVCWSSCSLWDSSLRTLISLSSNLERLAMSSADICLNSLGRSS